MTSSSGVVLLAGAVVTAYGMIAFNRAHEHRSAAGGLGSGLSPGTREALSVVVILVGLVTMFAAVIDY